MSTLVQTDQDKLPARPLHVLVPLIRSDLDQARDASERAGMPFYQAAGEKMAEAKAQMKHGEFGAWVKRNFSLSPSQASRYMAYARTTGDEQNSRAREFPSLNAFLRETGGAGYTPNKPRPQPWHEPVREVLGKVDVDQLNRHRDTMKRDEELRAEHRLALQLIDIGYKALATKLHPDKGGSREAMARLNRVRDHLRKSA